MITTLHDLVNLFPSRGEHVYARIFDGEQFKQMTYLRLHENLTKVTAYLQVELNLQKEDKVLLSSENRPEWQISYLGITSNGLIGVPLDVMLSDEEMDVLIGDSGSTVMFVSGAIFEKLHANQSLMAKIKHWVIFDKVDKAPSNAVFLEDVLSQPLPNYKTNVVNPDDVASLIYTSGTTGFSKAVLLTHANFAHQANNLAPLAEIVPSDVVMSLLPLHHTFMFSIEMTILGVGSSITYIESLKPSRIIAAVSETGITIMIGIPALYKKLIESIQLKVSVLPGAQGVIVRALAKISEWGYRLTGNHKVGEILLRSLRQKAGFSTVRYLISGAGPLALKTADGYATFGFNLANGYGLTEAAPVCSVNPPRGPVDNKSVGVLPANTWWKIDEPNAEGIGEICIKGANVMKGYFNNPEATAAAIDTDGWLHTGDMGYIGTIKGREYLYITGRLKNIIVTSGGKNIYPEEIEEQINAHPYVLESVVMGVPISDTDAGEEPCALIVINMPLMEENNLTDVEAIKTDIETHVRDIVNKKLKSYQVLRGWEIRTEELLKNTTRKVKRFEYPGKDYRYLLKK
ncbi:MAG: AMP-dependent synthetase/ligase [Brevinema sp.]